MDISDYIGKIIITVGEMYASENELENKEAITAMNAVVKTIEKPEMSNYIK